MFTDVKPSAFMYGSFIGYMVCLIPLLALLKSSISFCTKLSVFRPLLPLQQLRPFHMTPDNDILGNQINDMLSKQNNEIIEPKSLRQVTMNGLLQTILKVAVLVLYLQMLLA